MKKILSFILLVSVLHFQALSQELPEDFYKTDLDFTIDRPIGLKFDHLGNALIFAKAGLIYAMNSDGDLQTGLVLDISEEVTDWGDHGLVSIILDPDFETNRYIYLYYTLDRHHMLHYGTSEYDPGLDIYNQASMGRVSRYTLEYGSDGIKADINSRKVIFGQEIGDGNPILMASHGVGTLAFGGDGSLLLSCGEGGSYTEFDIGNAVDTYHEQAIEDGIIQEEENIGAFRSMLRTNFSGKVLRIDPETGEGLPNNPFYDSNAPNSKASKIWAYGFRNPYKIVYVPNTSTHTDQGDLPGKFVVGDVGSSLWEELNLVEQSGQWFGWPKHEGIHFHWAFKSAVLDNPEMPNPKFVEGCGPEYFTFDDFLRQERADEIYEPTFSCPEQMQTPSSYKQFIHRRPIMTYSNDLWNSPAKTEFPSFDDEGNPIGILMSAPENTVIGEVIEGGSAMPGAFCDSSLFPEEYLGDLFMLDYHGWINTITIENDQVTEIKKFAKLEKGITDLQFNPFNGKLYYVHLIDGKVVEVSYGGIRPPVAKIGLDKLYGNSPLVVNFEGSGSQSFDESLLSYEWSFGDGEMSIEENPMHTFDVGSEIQTFEVTLTVRDTSGNVDSTRKLISINNSPPLVNITSIEDGQTYSQATVNIFDLEAAVTDLEDDQDALKYTWQVNLHHSDHVHLGPVDNDPATYALIDPTGCTLESFFYRIYLTVEDEAGLIGKDSVSLYPFCDDDFSQFDQFTASFVEDGVLLKWDIAIEDDVDYYIVERTDDFKFEPIQTIDAEGLMSYSFLDSQPFEGVNRYRIRSVNTNGDRDYSELRVLTYFSSFGYHLSPNPVTHFFNIEVSKPFINKIEFRLFDLTGKKYFESIEEYDNLQIVNTGLDLLHVPSGVYVYHLIVDGERISGKITKF